MQADKVSEWEAQEAAVESIRQENEVQLDHFVHSLNRPMTPEERAVFLRARAGLDVPESNPLGLRPLSAAIPKPRCDPPLPPRYPCEPVLTRTCLEAIYRTSGSFNCHISHKPEDFREGSPGSAAMV